MVCTNAKTTMKRTASFISLILLVAGILPHHAHAQNSSVTWTFSSPRQLVWNDTTHEYVGNPFKVEWMAVNNGDSIAHDISVTLEVDTSAFTLVSPATATQWATPRDLAPGELCNAVWMITARPRATGDSLRVTLIATREGRSIGSGSRLVWVPAAGGTVSVAPESPVAGARLAVLPQPAADVVSVALEGWGIAPVHVRIVDVLGRTVRELRNVPAGGILRMSLAGEAPGAYVVIASSGATVRMQRIVTR